jgi:hypothetical protein
MRKLLFLLAALAGLALAAPAQAQVTCPPLPYNLLNGTIPDASQVMADLNALQACFGNIPAQTINTCPNVNTGAVAGDFLIFNGTVWCFGSLTAAQRAYDLATFWPGIPPASAITRIAITRSATCSAAFAGSTAYARESASGVATVNINQYVGASGTNRGSATFTISSTGVFASSAGMTLSPGDIVEFAFPVTPDSTLGDVAITLACSRS